jgi:hypothetical protein
MLKKIYIFKLASVKLQQKSLLAPVLNYKYIHENETSHSLLRKLNYSLLDVAQH